MKVRPCDTCGNMVSISAASCPNCGSTTCNADSRNIERNIAKLSRFSWKAYILPVLVCLAGIGGLFDAGNVKEFLLSLLLVIIGGGVVVGPRLLIMNFKKMYNQKINSFSDYN